MAGVNVVWAANHWPVAVDCHAANHPGTLHACQDLHQADWSRVPAHDLLLASPCCQGHSKARGKAANNPQHDASRSTAWAVVSAAEFHRPAVVVVENVPEFADWALYQAWQMAMQALGYTLAPHIVDAADHGVAQHRTRLFLVCTRSKRPLMLQLPKGGHVGSVSIIDFDSGRWSSINKPGRSTATLSRVSNGRAAHGERFVTCYYGSERGGRSLARPLGAITTRDRWAVIDGDRMRMLSADECRKAMGFPEGYRLPVQHKQAVHLLGNAVVPIVARDIINAIQAAA
jgi:DNA (cytosine-5)-methyltransferase 1